MSTTILFSTFPPFPTLSLSVPAETRFEDLYGLLCDRYLDLPSSNGLTISSHAGSVPPETIVSTLHGEASNLITLRLVPRLVGGKGGFGSQLRAAGGRMSSQKTSNNDSCRDLSGRRLSTIKTAKKLSDYQADEPLRKKAEAEARLAKIEALERKIKSGDPESLAGTKHRFDDTEYLEESREIVDSVKTAVTAGLLKKKKKKAKISHESSTPPKDTDSNTAASVTEKVVGSPTSAPALAAVTSITVGVASA
ncbi:telomere stability and silencing-domain-containing protein [Hygrophoropsis aurantiaca]|uniref:Telomere stability and silencing-domain-containing protein n=1 Tax=Hygrophoropsis aurantiaca TaxID=72124 RepID=A0ACB8AHA2_9AGAM|nr:telomere stability and silencing-domain-containing protein [Hygrophoropsis aurantiaca]